MANINVRLALLVLGFAFFVSTTEGMKCKGFEVKEWEPEKLYREACMKENPAKAKNIEELLNNPCFRKCLVLKRGIANESGELNKEKAIEMAQMMSPKEVHSEVVPKFTECLEVHGSKIKEMNGSCESYAAICMCMEKHLVEICGMQ